MARGNGSGVTGDQIQDNTITSDNMDALFLASLLQAANNLSDVGNTPASNNNLFAESSTVPTPSANAFTLDSTYLGAFVNLDNSGTAFTVSLPVGTVGYLRLYNEDSVYGTVSPASGTIDGGSSYMLAPQAIATLFCDGSNYHTMAFGPNPSGFSGPYIARGGLTSTQLLGLHSGSVSLVTQPAGYGIVPISLTLEYLYNSTAYTVPSGATFNLQVGGTGNIGGSIPCAGLVDQTANIVSSTNNLYLNNVTQPGSYFFNGSGIVLYQAGSAALTLGNGTMKWWLSYSLIPQ